MALPVKTPSRTRGQYRKYLRDSTAPVPRASLWRYQKHANSLGDESIPVVTPQSFISSVPSVTEVNPSSAASALSSLLSSQEASASLASPTRLPVNSDSSPVSPNSHWAPPPGPFPSSPGSLTSTPPSPSPGSPGSPTSTPYGPSPGSPGSPTSTPSGPSPGSPGSPTSTPSGPSPGSPGSQMSTPPGPSPSSPGSQMSTPPGPSPSSPGSQMSTPPGPSPSSPSSLMWSSLAQGDGLPSKESTPELFEPLYPGAEISVCAAMCAIMQFCSSNKLSFTAISELLKLLLLLCPTPNLLPPSFYKFKKFFKQFQFPYTHQKVCPECQSFGGDCICLTKPAPAHLVHIPIKKPLQTVLSNHSECLLTPRAMTAEESSVSDVWDGTAMRRMTVANRFFSAPRKLALSLSTDGVALFKSSSVSLWPVYLVLLNLPARIRMNAENVLLSGLWVGPTKPPIKLLLTPVMDKLRQYCTQGLTVRLRSGLAVFHTKVILAIFDLPAKAPVLCMKQYNGKFGCSVCLHPGKRLSNGSRIFLPDKYPDRTHADVLHAARLAERTNSVVDGVKGMSSLATNMDLVASVPIDYMHAVLEGVVRMLMNFWFKSSNHGQPQYLGNRIANIDAQLLRQRPPHEFSRPPRSIKKHLKYWKASELRNWLLYYSLPLLLGHLPPLYWHHYALLVCALHVFLKDRITFSQIDAADQMLRDFYLLFPQLYGNKGCTHNLHLLSHLSKYVRLWGPLWTHSAFGFESKNGQLKHLFHGRNNIVNQLLFNIDVSLTLQLVHPHLVQNETDETLEFLNHVSHTAPRSNMTSIGQHTYIVGKVQVITPTVEQSGALACDGPIGVFSRLFKDGVLYHSITYSRSCNGKRDSTTCYYRSTSNDSTEFGQIELFTATPRPTVLLRTLKASQKSLMQQAGHPCRPELAVYQEVDLLKCFVVSILEHVSGVPLVAIPIENILGKAVIVSSRCSKFVIVQPNSYERH